MKELSVVFLIYKEKYEPGKDNFYILLGKQAPGKSMPGIRNGFGGKCEEGERTLDCAVRELREESGCEFDRNNFIKIGNVLNDDKSIDFYTVFTDAKLELKDNSEMVDIKWFDLSCPQVFLADMLSGDHAVISELQKFVTGQANYVEFKINKTGDTLLSNQTRNIFDIPK